MVKIHGRWCGPNWTNNQVKPAEDANAADRKGKCMDQLDCACKVHDLQIKDNGPSFESDTELMRKAEAILGNPLYFIINPGMYASARVVREGMRLVRWTRQQ
jgi:hypothetical protein